LDLKVKCHALVVFNECFRFRVKRRDFDSESKIHREAYYTQYSHRLFLCLERNEFSHSPCWITSQLEHFLFSEWLMVFFWHEETCVRPLSQDLRQRIIAAREHGEGAGEVCKRFRPDVKRARTLWRSQQSSWDVRRLVFIDETGLSTKLARLYGRCSRGEHSLRPCVTNKWQLRYRLKT
jgi:hypothetical protein